MIRIIFHIFFSAHPTATGVADFFGVFDDEDGTDAAALDFLSDMDASELFSLLDGPLSGGVNSSDGCASSLNNNNNNNNGLTFPHSTGNASDSGISNVSSGSTPGHGTASSPPASDEAESSLLSGVTGPASADSAIHLGNGNDVTWWLDLTSEGCGLCVFDLVFLFLSLLLLHRRSLAFILKWSLYFPLFSSHCRLTLRVQIFRSQSYGDIYM